MTFKQCSYVLLLLVSQLSFALDINKGSVDDRQYEYFELKNGLKALIISDPTTDKAAASLDVAVGSADNPKGREGLAHFLEHMLFLGTKKYPEADTYQQYISEHGGNHNAYTSLEHTNYFFDVSHPHLEPTLDQFAQFFIAPLFNEAYVDRERKAVHSEYQAKIKDDFRRGYDVYRELLNPEHPYAQFSVGSLKTLADRPNDPVREDLIEFYKKHYTADNMTLVVLGREPLPKLKAMVESRFNQVPASKGAVNSPRPALFKSLPKTVYIKPVKDSYQLTLVFPLPSVKEYVYEKPLSYLGHILGYEGAGSVLSVLKSKGWAEGLSAGGDNQSPDHSTFTISITLTPEGYKNIAQIEALVFHAIDELAKNGIESWRFEEAKQLLALDFQFKEKADPMNTVSQLSNNMHYYASKDIIRGDYAMEKYDSQLIQRFVMQLNQQNVLIMIAAPDVETDKTSLYYQVPYRVSDKKPAIALESDLKAAYRLPKANPYVATNLTVLTAGQESEPKLMLQLSGQDFWYLQNDQFKVPRAFLASRIKSPLISSDLRSAAIASLWEAMIDDSLNETLYDASLAGLSVTLDATSRSIDLTVSGYSDKMPLLLSEVLKQIQSHDFDKARFVTLKEELIRSWNNTRKQTPFRRLFRHLPTVVYSPYWGAEDMAQALENVSFEELVGFSKAWTKGAHQEGLLYGNISSDAAKQMFRDMSSLVISEEGLQIQQASVAKVSGQYYEPVSVSHTDQAVVLYIQAKKDELRGMAKMMLIKQIIEAPFYSSLRTEQQLGYIVFAAQFDLKEVPAIALVVQSPAADVKQLQTAVETFIRKFQLPSSIDTFREAVISSLNEKPKSLLEQGQDYWSSILRDDNNFGYRQALIEQLRAITDKELIDYYQSTIQSSSSQLWLYSQTEKGEGLISPKPLKADGYYRYH